MKTKPVKRKEGARTNLVSVDEKIVVMTPIEIENL